MSKPTCSNRGCDEPATAIYVSTGNVRHKEVRYPRCDRHPMGERSPRRGPSWHLTPETPDES